MPLRDGAHLLVFSWAAPDCGVPCDWNATAQNAGIALLPDLQEDSVQQLAAEVARQRQSGDLVLISLHWGGNWGLDIPPQHQRFAQRLIDLGAADLVHGHSSHHPRPIEVYRGRLILYGCGDLINDYEGITSQEPFDSSAVCLYFAQISRADGTLQQLEIVPMQLRRLQLRHAGTAARRHLLSLFETGGRPFRTGVQVQDDGRWKLHW